MWRKGIGPTAQYLGVDATAFMPFVSGIALSVSGSHILFGEDVPGVTNVMRRSVHLQ